MSTVRRVSIPLAVAALSLVATTLPAEEASFSATLDGKANIPDPIATAASGELKLHLAADGRSIRYEVVVKDLVNATSADLHVGPTNANGPLVVKLFPAGDAAARKGPFSGVLAQGTFTASNLTGPMNGASLADLVEEIAAGNTYCNVHTNDGADPPNSGPGDYRLGEIRG
jgi:hypothetical protein